AARAAGLRADLGRVRRHRAGLPDALRPAPRRVPGADVRDRPAGLVARHPLLERGEPAPAADAGRPADRVRDALGAELRLRAARPRPAAADAGRHRVGAACEADAGGGRGTPELTLTSAHVWTLNRRPVARIIRRMDKRLFA